MQWRQVGPFRGGRALAIEGIPNEPGTYYFGAVAGGVWKTTDGGANWAPLFDKETISSIGAIAVAPSDHNVVYAGTGEAAVRGNISYGAGVYKSVDAGKTWKNIGLKDTRHIGALIVDPKNADIVLVAALGHIFRPEPGARNFSHDRWRQNLDEGPEQRPGDGRDRRRVRSAKLERRFRGALAGAPAAVVFLERRTGQRFVSIGRWRRDLETARRAMVCRKEFSGGSA